MIGLEHVHMHAGRPRIASAREPADRVHLSVTSHPHRERRRIRPHELERGRPIVRAVTRRVRTQNVQLRTALERHRAERRAIRARIVRVAVDEGPRSHPRCDRIAQRLERHVRGRILILPEVAHRDVPLRREELAQPLVVIRMRMRENHGVDGRAVQAEHVELVAKRMRIWPAVHEHGRSAILNENRVALADVEHPNEELPGRAGGSHRVRCCGRTAGVHRRWQRRGQPARRRNRGCCASAAIVDRRAGGRNVPFNRV